MTVPCKIPGLAWLPLWALPSKLMRDVLQVRLELKIFIDSHNVPAFLDMVRSCEGFDAKEVGEFCDQQFYDEDNHYDDYQDLWCAGGYETYSEIDNEDANITHQITRDLHTWIEQKDSHDDYIVYEDNWVEENGSIIRLESLSSFSKRVSGGMFMSDLVVAYDAFSFSEFIKDENYSVEIEVEGQAPSLNERQFFDAVGR